MSVENPWQWLARKRIGPRELARMVGEEIERGGRRGAFIRVSERAGIPYGKVRSMVYSWKRRNEK